MDARSQAVIAVKETRQPTSLLVTGSQTAADARLTTDGMRVFLCSGPEVARLLLPGLSWHEAAVEPFGCDGVKGTYREIHPAIDRSREGGPVAG